MGLVLYGVESSYSKARSDAANEANVVDNLFETTEYLPNPARQVMRAPIVCYARAVAGPEWRAMAKGQGSSVPSNYTGKGPDGLRRMFIALGPSNDLFGKLTSADATRGDARGDRLAQAKPTVPTVVSGFMLLLVGLTVVALAFSMPRADHGPQIVTLVIVIILTGGALLLMRGLHRPFSGVLAIKPTEIRITAEQVTTDYMASYPASPLPCDDQGNPTAPPQQSTPTTTRTAPTPTTTTVTTTTTITS